MSGSIFTYNPQAASSAISGIGGAVSDLFAGQGAAAEASSYGQGAAIAGQNAVTAAAGGALQQAQTTRQAYQVISTGEAQAAANGLTGGGSAASIARSSRLQAGLQNQVTGVNTALQVAGYQEQQTALLGEQQAAEAAGTGAGIGGALSGLGAIASIASMF